MENNMSHSEQKVYFSLEPGHIYDVDFIAEQAKIKKDVLLVLLSRMQRKRWVERVKRGRYIVNTATGTASIDHFAMALNVFDGYLGFSSALYIYGAMDEVPSTIYVCTVDRTSTKILQNTEIKAVSLGKRATGMVYFKGYFVSSRAKTLYDCFYMPQLSGGYSNLLAAINRLKLSESDWKTFIFYMNRFGNQSFSRKVGFLLDLLSENTAAAIPVWVLKELNIGKQIVKLGRGTGGKFNKKWMVVNYIDEKDLLGKVIWKR
ncbi:MAG: hypothetical protein OH316_00725 [Candidatus Parvarchaeota archaeon]|nr:hypothetical protein [Candidatus Parvarchaeota archaeon]